jgi:glutamate synthase domain-containing protein 2
VPCAKVLGEARGRAKAFRPASIVNVSGMSFGSLSGPAVEAMNRGCSAAHCLHDTGEGGVSKHHLHGADLIWQVGTGYFGCRDAGGRFDLERLVATCAEAPVRAACLKLSQGAKPGKGGILPGAKVSEEIARVRGIPAGRDCKSPSGHSAFRDPDSMLDLVETIAARTGLPVGIKSAVGQLDFWHRLAELMESGERGVDFIQVDGGEGGTGAAPLVYSDHVALPFVTGFARVYRIFAERGLAERIVWIGSGRLGFPDRAIFAMALGCDLVHVAREAMMAVGCIQAQRCHSGHCPTGVATQLRWLARGLDPTSKAVRLANYLTTLRSETAEVARSCGAPHPAFLTGDQLELLDGRFGAVTVREHFGYADGWGRPSPRDRERLLELVGEEGGSGS